MTSANPLAASCPTGAPVKGIAEAADVTGDAMSFSAYGAGWVKSLVCAEGPVVVVLAPPAPVANPDANELSLTQVPPTELLFAPSGQIVPGHMTEVVDASVRSAPARFACRQIRTIEYRIGQDCVAEVSTP